MMYHTAEKGKYGWYAVSRYNYNTLKEIRREYFKALIEAHRWHRWARKADHNRVGPEPEVNEFFVEKVRRSEFRMRYTNIVAEFHIARTPYKDPLQVPKIDYMHWHKVHRMLKEFNNYNKSTPAV